jgi:hypothetical protein
MIVTNAIPARSINVSSADFDCVFMRGPQGLLPGESISTEVAGGITGGEFNPEKGLIDAAELKGSFMVTAVCENPLTRWDRPCLNVYGGERHLAQNGSRRGREPWSLL